MSREDFRAACVERDGGVCVVPWCGEPVDTDPSGQGEVHHIIERELWPNGGYRADNGASVCNMHHRYAERNHIPPQAFWRWIGDSENYVPLPASIASGNYGDEDTVSVWPSDCPKDTAVDKWGESWEAPPHAELREFHKYPSTRHLLPLYWQSERGTAEERTGRDDTGLTEVDSFLDTPLVATIKMDGSNAMLVKDHENPVRARNGTDARHESFDMLKDLYWDHDVYAVIPDHLQVFGEWLYAKHSIKYEDDTALRSYFQVFGVFDTRYNLWLSWPEVEYWANQIDFPTTPVVEEAALDSTVYENEHEFVEKFTTLAERVVDAGHEGIVIRRKFPFHYGQFGEALGKYVRPNHVRTDEHWSHQQVEQNELR